jgi:hypothetical protein
MANSFLDITVKTWKPDNHGLFDFYAFDIMKNSFKVSKPCTIFRQDENCYIPGPVVLDHSIPVITVSKFKDSFHLSLENDEPGLVMWKIVTVSKKQPEGHHLVEGDWVKLGKVMLRVRQVGDPVTASQNYLFHSFFTRCNNSRSDVEEEKSGCVQACNSGLDEEGKDSQKESFVEDKEIEDFQENHREMEWTDEKRSKRQKFKKKSKEAQVCRICLFDSNSDNDPLISPCKCKGTVSKVHVQCLQEWLKSRIQSHVSAKTVSFYLKDLTCELCKVELPYKFRFNNRDFMLINFSYPLTCPFVMMEEFTFDRKQVVALHVVTMKEGEKVRIGRSIYSDLKIVDLTVSRTHCKIQLIGSKFLIKDKNSKFGTLIEISKEIKVKNSEINLQIGRSVLKIIEKYPFKCCKIFKKTNKIEPEKSAGKTQAEVFEGLVESTGFLPVISIP